jgi:hypothetical protein
MRGPEPVPFKTTKYAFRLMTLIRLSHDFRQAASGSRQPESACDTQRGAATADAFGVPPTG